MRSLRSVAGVGLPAIGPAIQGKLAAKRLRVLVACEYSGAVRDAFTALGHYAMSCDLLPSETPGPHYQGSVFDVINDGWDLMIAFPPCTFLAVSGNRWMNDPRYPNRAADRAAGEAFFMAMINAAIPMIAVENPVGIMSTVYRKPDQVIQPWMFGTGEVKATCIWVKGLPLLVPTDIVTGREAKVHRMPPGPNRGKDRAKTYPGVAAAMAMQWGGDARLAPSLPDTITFWSRSKAVLKAAIKQNPILLRDPHASKEILLEFASLFPAEVERNPVLPLLMLEEPTFYLQLKEQLGKGWITHEFESLPHYNLRLLAVEMAERALPALKENARTLASHRTIAGAEYALQLARDVANGETQRAGEMYELSQEMHWMAKQLDGIGEEAAQQAAWAVGAVTIPFSSDMPIAKDDLRRRNVNVEHSVAEVADHARQAVAMVAGGFPSGDPMSIGKSPELDFDAMMRAETEEFAWQVEQVKAAHAQVLRDEESRKKRHTKLKHKPTAEEVYKQAQIDAAIAQAQADSDKIRTIMQSHRTADWPVWVGLGMVAAGTVAAILIGPEILAGAAAGYGFAELGIVSLSEAEISAAEVEAVSMASSEAAAELATVVDTSGVTVVSLGEVEAAATIGEMISARDAEFLLEIVAKLQALRPAVTFTTAAAEVVVRMPK